MQKILIFLSFLISILYSDQSIKTVNVLLGYDKPPFIFGQTTLTGIEADLVKEAFSLVGYKVVVSQGTRAEQDTILNSENSIDAVATISEINPNLFYSDTLTIYENYAITRKKENIKIDSIEDLKKLKFVTWKNSFNDLGEKFNTLYNPQDGKYKESYHDTLTQMNDAKLFFSQQMDAIITDITVFKWHKIYFNNHEEYTYHKIFDTYKKYPVAFRSKKMRDDFNIGLNILKKNGRYDEIMKFYETQDVGELIKFTELLSAVSSKYIFEQKKEELRSILKTMVTHPDIEAISIKSKNEQFLYLNLQNRALDSEKSQEIISKIYYKTESSLLHLGELSLIYKKEYKTKNGSPILTTNSLKMLSSKEYDYIDTVIKKLNPQDELTPYLTKEEKEYIDNKKSVKVCAYKKAFPFVIPLKDSVTGSSIEFLNLISEKSKLNFEIILTQNLDEHFEMIKNGICDASSVMPAKPNIYDFLTPSHPVLSDIIVLVTKINEPYIGDLNSLDNKKIAIGKGEKNIIKYVNSVYPKIHLAEVDASGLQKVVSDEFYGYVAPSFEVSHKIATEHFNELKIMSKIGDEKIDGSFGISNKEPILLSIFNKSIDNISQLQKQNIANAWLSVKVDKQFDYTRFMQFMSVAILIILILLFSYFKQRKLHKKINLLNKTLEKRVSQEVAKNTKHQLMLMHQNKQAQMGEMIENIAHQWRQPLAQINSSVLLIDVTLAKNSIESNCIEDRLLEIESLTAYMSKTIEDFKNFFSPNKQKTVFSIEDAIEKSYNIVKGIIHTHHIEVDTDIENNISCCCYLDELQQAILTLLSNSVDAMVFKAIKSPKISIKAYKKDSNIIIDIQDNAKGIPPEFFDKIFEPYFTTKHKTQGTGLGLYMAKMIIESGLEGKLSVVNKSDGACFTIELPQGNV
ncbi:MAG: transporter substrate-binding domain-containing protein [Arcobacteraceae bacterium]